MTDSVTAGAGYWRMEEVAAFLRDYVEAEHAAQMCLYTERDDAVLQVKLDTLQTFHAPAVPPDVRAPLVRDESWFSQAAETLGSIQPRVLFQIKHYQHPELGDLFRAYVSSNLRAGKKVGYFASLYLAGHEGRLRIVSRYLICLDCEGAGRVNGKKCRECKGKGWEYFYGLKLPDPGALIEVRRLRSPDIAQNRVDYDSEETPAPLVDVPHAERLTSLRAVFEAGPGEESWDALCCLLDAWPAGMGLERALEIAQAALTEWHDVFCSAPLRWCVTLPDDPDPRLCIARSVLLYFESLGDAGAARLAKLPVLSSLTWLKLNHTEIGPRGAAALARSPVLTRLSFFSLSENPLGPKGGKALSGSALAGLTHLHLNETGLGDEGVAALADAAAMPGMRCLRLRSNGITSRGVARLAASPLAADLSELDLEQNAVDDAGAQALAESPHLASLVTVSLLGSNIGRVGQAALRAAGFRHSGGQWLRRPQTGR